MHRLDSAEQAGMDISELKRELEELNAALLRHDGDVGRILKYVIERGRGCTGCSLDGLDESLADNVYLAAVQWASECLDVG